MEDYSEYLIQGEPDKRESPPSPAASTHCGITSLTRGSCISIITGGNIKAFIQSVDK